MRVVKEKKFIKGKFTTVKAGELGLGIRSDQTVEKLKQKLLISQKVVPISITDDGFIVDGEHRYKALMDLGVIDIPVYVGEQMGACGRLVEPYAGIWVDIDIPKEK